MLYADPNPDSVREAVQAWDLLEHRVRPRALRQHASQFSEAEFHRKMDAVLFPSAMWDADPCERERHVKLL